jgi:hypothetical protein
MGAKLSTRQTHRLCDGPPPIASSAALACPASLACQRRLLRALGVRPAHSVKRWSHLRQCKPENQATKTIASVSRYRACMPCGTRRPPTRLLEYCWACCSDEVVSTRTHPGSTKSAEMMSLSQRRPSVCLEHRWTGCHRLRLRLRYLVRLHSNPCNRPVLAVPGLPSPKLPLECAAFRIPRGGTCTCGCTAVAGSGHTYHCSEVHTHSGHTPAGICTNLPCTASTIPHLCLSGGGARDRITAARAADAAFDRSLTICDN